LNVGWVVRVDLSFDFFLYFCYPGVMVFVKMTEIDHSFLLDVARDNDDLIQVWKCFRFDVHWILSIEVRDDLSDHLDIIGSLERTVHDKSFYLNLLKAVL
jgi:hypothetical protein